MTFKKNGTDPEYNPAPFIGLRWIGAAAIALGLAPDPNAKKRDEIVRYLRGSKGKPQAKHKRRRNMLTVSKRVRRKHRRSA